MVEKVRSSLPLQLAIYFNQLYLWVFSIVSLLLYFYKGKPLRFLHSPPLPLPLPPFLVGYELPYPAGSIGWEITSLVFFFLAEKLRLFACKAHNPAGDGVYCTNCNNHGCARPHCRSNSRQPIRACGAHAVGYAAGHSPYHPLRVLYCTSNLRVRRSPH